MWNLLFDRSCSLNCVQYCCGDIHWQVMMMIVVMVMLMVMVMVMVMLMLMLMIIILYGHINPQAAEETTTTNLGQTKTQCYWRIWGFDSHFGSTDQDLKVCAVKSNLFAIWKLVCLMWGAMLAANATNHLVSCFIYMSRPRPGLKFKVHTNYSLSNITLKWLQ